MFSCFTTKQEALQGEKAKTVHINLTVFGLTQPGFVAQFSSLDRRRSYRLLHHQSGLSVQCMKKKWFKQKHTMTHVFDSKFCVYRLYLACYHGFIFFYHIYLMLDFYFISRKIQKSKMKKKRKERKS